jgi:hypothetical protein
MTKDEYTHKLREIDKASKIWRGKAEMDMRKVIKDALQAWYRTGIYDADEVNSEITEIMKSELYTAADKTAALSQKYLTEALIGRGWKQSLTVPGLFTGPGGKQTTIPMPIAHNYELSSSVWGADQYKARAQAVVDYARANGRSLKDTAADLNTLCSYNGPRILAKKYDRLYRVKNDNGSINQKRWQEGWARDWCAENGVQFGSPEYEAALANGSIDSYIKSHGYKGNRQLLPKVHTDFIKRLGSSDIDYRAARIMRTEAAQAQTQAMTTIGTGKYASKRFKVELSAHRDAWHCGCQAIVREVRKHKGGVTLAELADIAYKHGGQDKPPFHPNCDCILYAVPLTIDEIARRAAADGS